jgi:hypothetical protein
MSRELSPHLDGCRRKGLTVDEDFERGVTLQDRVTRSAALALFLILLAFVLATLVTPHLTESVLVPSNAPAGERPASTGSRSPLFHHDVVRVIKGNV